MKKYIGIIVIVLLAATLRLYMLGSNPPALNADECAISYNAYSILKTGKDEFGAMMPLAFRSFDDYKAPLYIYAVVPSIVIFGLTDFAVRFPSALMGILTVLFVYLLIEELLKQTQLKNTRYFILDTRYLPALSAGLLAISPWHLQFSRSAYEANVAVGFIVLGMWMLIKGLRDGKWLMGSAIALSLSMWTYHTPRLFVPLLLIGVLVIWWKDLWKQKTWAMISICVAGALLLPLAIIMTSKEGLVRAKGVSALGNPAIMEQSIKRQTVDQQQHIPGSGFIHNRRFDYMTKSLQGYLTHFDPAFLFFERAERKYRAPGMGMLYLFELPLLLVGLMVIGRYKKMGWLILWWIVMAPVAASFTERLPHPVRTIVFLPALQILAAIGLIQIIEWVSQWKKMKWGIYGCIAIVIVGSVGYYLHQYYVHMPIEYAADWQYGRKQVVEAVRQVEGSYDRIVVSMSLDQSHIFFLNYLPIHPQAYVAQGGTISGKFDAEDNVYDTYVFKTISKYTKEVGKKILYVGAPNEVGIGATIIKTIQYPDGTSAFILFEQ